MRFIINEKRFYILRQTVIKDLKPNLILFITNSMEKYFPAELIKRSLAYSIGKHIQKTSAQNAFEPFL